jgi:hypothetical protein
VSSEFAELGVRREGGRAGAPARPTQHSYLCLGRGAWPGARLPTALSSSVCSPGAPHLGAAARTTLDYVAGPISAGPESQKGEKDVEVLLDDYKNLALSFSSHLPTVASERECCLLVLNLVSSTPPCAWCL